jgi:hypothetical protein
MAGGSIKEVSVKGRVFEPPADADATLKFGGYVNEVAPNGGGGARLLKTREPWSTEGLSLAIDHAQGDQEFLQGVSDEVDFVDISITLVDDRVFEGRGALTGGVSSSTANSTGDINFSGPGNMSQ